MFLTWLTIFWPKVLNVSVGWIPAQLLVHDGGQHDWNKSFFHEMWKKAVYFILFEQKENIITAVISSFQVSH